MRRSLLLAAVLLMGGAAAASAQEEPVFPKTFSLEVSTGYQPLHMNYSPSTARKQELAELGQAARKKDAYYPVINLTGVYRPWKRTEFTFTAGASWCFHPVTQYEVFGTDPYGKPRYDLQKGTPAGWKGSTPFFNVTLQWRHLWTPRHMVVLYSGAGAGIVFNAQHFFPAPSVTLIGLRAGGKHFYAFAECPIGPLATLIHGGLGWHF